MDTTGKTNDEIIAMIVDRENRKLGKNAKYLSGEKVKVGFKKPLLGAAGGVVAGVVLGIPAAIVFDCALGSGMFTFFYSKFLAPLRAKRAMKNSIVPYIENPKLLKDAFKEVNNNPFEYIRLLKIYKKIERLEKKHNCSIFESEPVAGERTEAPPERAPSEAPPERAPKAPSDPTRVSVRATTKNTTKGKNKNRSKGRGKGKGKKRSTPNPTKGGAPRTR